MVKKLLISLLAMLFVAGTSVAAKVGDGASVKAEKPTTVLLEKHVLTYPKAVFDKASPDRIATKKTEAQINEFVDSEGDVVRVTGKASSQKPALTRKKGYLYPGDPNIYPAESARNSRDALPHGDLFNYDDEATEYYLSGGTAGDEWGIWFQSPQAACSLYAVELTFFAGEGGGTIDMDVMAAGTVWPDTVWQGNAANAYVGDSISVADIFGDNLMGADETFPLEIAATGAWEQFVFPDWDYMIDVGRDIFWIHWTKSGDSPMLLSDDANLGDYLHTWSFEPVQDGDEKWSHYGASVGIEAMVRCEVIFYEDPPPTLQASQMNDTYLTDAITVSSSASDNALDPALVGIASGNLVYSVSGGDWVTVAATVTGDTAVGFTLTSTIPAGASGDDVSYYFDALDLAGLYGRSFPALSFSRTEPMYPDADVLVVRDGMSDRQRDLLEAVLDDNDFVYELWDADASFGIDASIIDAGWSNILVLGWGSSTVPMFAADSDPGYAAFIDGGGNLFLGDMDWMCGSSAGCGDATFTWVAGDFAFDYFGLASGANDPGTIEIVPVTGVTVTEFDGLSLELDHAAYLLTADAGWIDYITPGSATAIFVDDAAHTVGTAMDHSASSGGKAVYLSFMADAAGDTLETGADWDYTQFATVVASVISYFGAVSPPAAELSGKGSTMYGVASGTNSATVSAKVIDNDGAVASVLVRWAVDDSAEYSAIMSNVSDDLYSASFILTGFTDTSFVNYWVEAIDDDGLSSYSETGGFWGTDFTRTAGRDVLYIFDSSYPNHEAYGAPVADSTVRANMTAEGLVYDSWSVADDYLPDFGSVLSNYEGVIYAGFLDWTLMPEVSAEHTLTEFVAGGGYLLYSSEEVLGTYTDWENLSFGAGHFAYDVLNVEWVGNDYNYDSVTVYDATSLTPGLATGNIPLDVDSYYFGSMADLCDPVGYGTVDQLPSPFIGWTTDYYASAQGDNVAFLGFNLSMMPTDQQQLLYANFADWVGLGVDDDVSIIPETFTLHQNYPNPFNPTTSIRYSIPEMAQVSLVIHNLIGQEVATLVNTNMGVGNHEVVWNGTDTYGKAVSSGVYFYTIKAGNFSNTKKMLFLK